MAVIRVGRREIDVDIEKELNEYTWHRAVWRREKLIACSPFRYDSSPSFYIYFEDTATARAGNWGDSGGSGEFKQGGFVKLLSFLRNETEEETVEYLLRNYASFYVDDIESLELDMEWVDKVRELKRQKQTLPIGILDQYQFRSSYLAGRGVSEAVQRLMHIGYDPERRLLVVPYFLPDGRLAAVKYRHTEHKYFFYEKGGYPMRELVYGIDVVFQRKAKRAVLVEAEIDAMYIMTVCRMPAIAVGTSKISDEKVELIARSGLEEVIIMSDHDKAGQGLKRQVIKKLLPHLDIKVAGYPVRYKDANEVPPDKLTKYIDKAKAVFPMFL